MPEVAAVPLQLCDHVTGHGPPLLLIHGGSGSHRHWERVVGGLARHFEVHAPDLPGFGDSPDVPADIDGEGYVDLAAASLDVLVPRQGVHMVGFSFGAALAAGVAKRWGHRVVALSLLGPGGFGNPQGRELQLRSRRDTDDSPASMRDLVRHNLSAMMFADPGTIDDATIDQQLWNLAHTRFRSVRVSLAERLLADLAAIEIPVQVIWGEHDALAHPTPADRAARVRGIRPDAQLEFVPNAGHWVQHEQPEAIKRLLATFHTQQTAPTENR